MRESTVIVLVIRSLFCANEQLHKSDRFVNESKQKKIKLRTGIKILSEKLTTTKTFETNEKFYLFAFDLAETCG